MSIVRRYLVWFVIGGLVIAGLIARLGWAARPWLAHRTQRLAFEARMAALSTLGDRELAKLTNPPTTELKTACAGKLRSAEPQALLAYFGKRPDKFADMRWDLPQEMLYGFGNGSPDSALSLHFQSVPFVSNSYDALSLLDFAFDKSRQWESMIDRFRASRPQADKGLYLLVQRIVDMTMPEVFPEGTFKPGTAVLQVRVVDAVSGELVCAGQFTTRSATKIKSHGTGTTRERAAGMAKAQLVSGTLLALGNAMKVGAIDVLCDAGGEQLCKSTSAEIENVDVFR